MLIPTSVLTIICIWTCSLSASHSHIKQRARALVCQASADGTRGFCHKCPVLPMLCSYDLVYLHHCWLSEWIFSVQKGLFLFALIKTPACWTGIMVCMKWVCQHPTSPSVNLVCLNCCTPTWELMLRKVGSLVMSPIVLFFGIRFTYKQGLRGLNAALLCVFACDLNISRCIGGCARGGTSCHFCRRLPDQRSRSPGMGPG